MAPVAHLDMDIPSPQASTYADRVERIDCYSLEAVDLSAYAALVIPPTADQEHLTRHRGLIRAFLESGGVVVFGGHLHRDWLPGASSFVPLEQPSLASYRVVEVAAHPIFAGVRTEDLTFRRGVAGFFARGHHPPPGAAEVLTRLAGGQPATYVDRVSTAGTILVHASGDLLGYADGMDSTAARIPDQLLDWATAEAQRRRGRPGQASPSGDKAGQPEASRGASPRGLAAVYGGSAPHHRTLTTPKYARHLTGGSIYLPDLPDTDLTNLGGLIVPERLHRGLLTRGAHRIQKLLNTGGTVIAFGGGEPIPEFLPGVCFEHRPTNYWWWREPGADLGLRSPTPEHSLFDHLQVRDCTWHYHGALYPPEGAEVPLALPTGEALLYIDRVSTAGTLVIATLDPISHYGSYFMPATERFLDGFLPWVTANLASRRPTAPHREKVAET